MAVAFDAVGPSSAGASSIASTTLSWTHTYVGSGVALFVAVAVGGNPDTGMTTTVKLDPSGAHTITATTSGGTPSSTEGGSLSYTGADTTNAFSAQQSSVGAATPASLTFTGSTAGNMVAGAVTTGSGVTSMTAGTSRWLDNADFGSAAGCEAGGDIAGGGSVTITWSITSDWWAVAAVEVLAVSGGGAPTFGGWPRIHMVRHQYSFA